MFLEYLNRIWENTNYPFLEVPGGESLCFSQISDVVVTGIEKVQSGDVVALIGDFNGESIACLLRLLAKGAIVAPLTYDTRSRHEYFITESRAQYVFEGSTLTKVIGTQQNRHEMLDILRDRNNPGLILFTTGTTGSPKAILHDFIPFISRYTTPRPPLKAISFLLFDHIGGINTLLHMLFNRGQTVSIKDRSVDSVAKTIKDYAVELLPTTPTFLRMFSLHPDIEKKIGDSLKIISYGTERMDQPTLERLAEQFPMIDFRQTYGMSELGILRIKSKARNSIYMNVGGEGVETKIIDNILRIRAKNRMIGYLNAESPFDQDGWYCTDDVVNQQADGSIAITGRKSDIINIAGLKFFPSEVEIRCLEVRGIRFAKAYGVSNPITGEYLEISIEPDTTDSFQSESQLKDALKSYLSKKLPSYMQPSRIRIEKQRLSHRFKRA